MPFSDPLLMSLGLWLRLVARMLGLPLLYLYIHYQNMKDTIICEDNPIFVHTLSKYERYNNLRG